MGFPRNELTSDIAVLAQGGVLVGTSSWKYEGWVGLLYTRDRYLTRGKFSRAKFESTCLTEYAEVFKTVCFDGGLYQFPSAKMVNAYLSQVPPDFRMSMKVTEDITVRRFPNIPRNLSLNRAGHLNERFLDANLFADRFLGPLEPFKEKIGTLIFEFSTIKDEWEEGGFFFEALERFLERLPRGWAYSVEVRNRSFLRPDYFDLLRRHGVAHTFNNWSDMPSVGEQIQLPDSFTSAFATARFLLKPGRTYNNAVKNFEPYSEIKEQNPEARAALISLMLTPAKLGHPDRKFLYINNRLEGCALWTIYAAIAGLFGKRKENTPSNQPFRLQ